MIIDANMLAHIIFGVARKLLAVMAILLTLSAFMFMIGSFWFGPVISGTGTVIFCDFEGGFYGIVADSGARYDPINMPEDFEVEGVRVSFLAYLCQDMLSYHMWGEIISLLSIERLAS